MVWEDVSSCFFFNPHGFCWEALIWSHSQWKSSPSNEGADFADAKAAHTTPRTRPFCGGSSRKNALEPETVGLKGEISHCKRAFWVFSEKVQGNPHGNLARYIFFPQTFNFPKSWVIWWGIRVMSNDLTVIHPNGIEGAIFKGTPWSPSVEFGTSTQAASFTRKAAMFNTHQFENRWGVEKCVIPHVNWPPYLCINIR